MGEDNLPETFQATGGRIGGVVGLLVGAAFVVVGLAFSPTSWGMAAAGALIAVLAWTAMLRPAAGIRDGALVLRGMVETVSIPLAAVEEVSVRQVLAVRAGARRYTSSAVGRSRRQMHRDDRRGDPVPHADQSYGSFVEDRIRARASDARDQLGIRPDSGEQAALAEGIERRYALPEIVALALAVLVAVLALLL